MGLFIAIDPPPEIAGKLAEMQQVLEHTKADVGWVARENYHITVKFLGETQESLVPEIATRLTNAAAQVPQFEVEVEGISRLPERGPARVIVSRVISPDQ